MATKNSTNDTANENFITDHGSIRLTNSRARRGPREAAEETAARALRTASATRPVPRGTARVRAPAALAAPTAAPEIGAVAESTGAARPPTAVEFTAMRAVAGTDARPVLTFDAGGDEVGAAGSAESGGGGMPGARVNFGPAPSPPTLARPTTALPRPAAAPSGAAFSGDLAPSE